MIWRFFVALSHNGKTEVHKTRVFLTRDSIQKNLPLYFGHATEFLSKRLHMVLTNDRPLCHVYINEFISKLYMPLFGTAVTPATNITKNHFVL
jgi:hypothetical protein